MNTVSSRQNPWFKRVRDAIREHAGEIVLEGPKSVRDAVRHGWKPIAIVCRDDAAPPESLQPITFVGSVFDELSSTKTSQGVIGLFERPRSDAASLFADHTRVVVALDGVQDPGNVGTIVRLAAAFDAAGVALLPGCADAFAPKAIRASAGAVLEVPVAQLSPRELIEAGWPIFAADGEGKPVDPPPAAAVLLFGSEGAGVSPELRDAATAIAIPMSPRVESLNVATAAAILLHRSYVLRKR